MIIELLMFAMLFVTFAMITAKRINAVINGFMWQSLLLFAAMLRLAVASGNTELYILAALVLAVKAVFIPYYLRKITAEMNVSQNMGLILNPFLSLLSGIALTYLCYRFAGYVFSAQAPADKLMLTISVSVIAFGLFLMVFRMKALSQIIGLLVMENGTFLLASWTSGGMPFIVELAVFFDLFVLVIIVGTFIYRINKLFTHIDVSKLTDLKG
ncbi:MAG: hypothetical protein A3J79_04640 [Elusimicrobia bacterium RIFOXYB2_FULL_62_6]|nr:MAG: hypothetical protein A3J79_04640 [Elusimicrobia bacterium RIFOXYB2_FULL_62_6]